MNLDQKRFLWNFIYESDLIESIRDNLQQLRDEIVSGKTDGHVGAMFLLHRLAEKKDDFLTKKIVCEVQKLITAEQHLKEGGRKLAKKCIGRYRQTRVSVYNVSYFTFGTGKEPKTFRDVKLLHRSPPPKGVPGLMAKWLESVVHWQKKFSELTPERNVKRIADFHFDFEQIHPFADGNGRTGRALAYYMLKYAGLRPFIFREFDKSKTYYPCFGDETKEKMREYFRLRVFEPKRVLSRIETMSVDDIVEF